MTTPPPPDLPAAVATDCGCGGERLSLASMAVVWSCAGCGQPRLTVTGALRHLALVLLDQAAAFGIRLDRS